ncbi:hypothetical protein [Nocardioides humi]|uniref:Bacteriocin biosynthesis cyclodehydratase domain-containing protein n=1 Tax=Nocardioides humi TaxID=449461 RepID=A0ABN2BUL5_9ACTN|nr:hypothetical protein [Nocardioides humi]
MASRPHLLRPGTPVLARSPGVLQVGLSGPTLRLPDLPEVRRLLADLTGRGAPGDARAAEAAGELPAAAADALTRLLGAGLALPAPPDAPDPGLAPLLAQAGPDAVRRRAARAASPVAVDAPDALRTVLDPLLSVAGLRVATAADDVRVRLVVADGPAHRDRLDPLVRASVPHLLVTGDATAVRVGPFVHPGRTACLRCVDAHESLRDARLPLLLAQAVAQYAERPPPRDPVLDHLALAWAVRDLARFLEGDEPSTWSTTVDLDPAAAPVLTRWGRHPDCGCAWDDLLDLP